MLYIDSIYFVNKQLHNYCINETSTSERKNILYANPFKIVSTNNFNMFAKYNGDFNILEEEVIKMFNVGYNLSSNEDDKKELIKSKEQLIKKIALKRNK